jgi:hypothetical protein
MLEVQDQEYLAEVRAFADKIGKRDDLERSLERLGGYRDVPVRCRLFRDFAPYSFGFVVEFLRGDKWVFGYNGGLIYHGAHDRGGDGGAPTFSVNLVPADGWRVHT